MRKAKSVFSIIISAVLLLSLLPVAVFAQDGIDSGVMQVSTGENNYSISANIEGAEIYINGEYSGRNIPAEISAQAGDTVTMYLPGYFSSSQTIEDGTGEYYFVLEPELYPEEYAEESKHIIIDAGYGYEYESLSQALQAMAEINSDIWCVIYLHDGADTNVSEECFRTRGRYTIYGGEGGTMMCSCINPWGVDGVRLINLNFSPLAWSAQFTIRADSGTKRAAVNTKNIYICGCTFDHASELGIFQCVEFNKGGTDYNSDGTYNVSNINFSNNDITTEDGKDWAIFNFAAAGDGDYNVIDGYNVIANRFTGAGVGFLTADAHSWYVYGQTAIDTGSFEASGNMGEGEIGVCEYNVIRNVLVSGNEIINGSIGLQSANLGNQNNLLEEAVIRNNQVINHNKDNDASASVFSQAISIVNVSVADNYEAGMRYHVEPGFTHTDNNTLKNVEVYGNLFEAGKNRESQIVNVNPGIGEQCGKNNSMSDISIYDNEFVSAQGVFINNYGNSLSEAESSECANNTMTDITFEGNRITNPVATDRPGLTVAGAYLSKHGKQYGGYPDYSGAMGNIYIKNNVINDYIYGISVAGCFGDYLNGHSISDVEIENNTITNKNQFDYAVTDVGIIVAGSTGQTSSPDYSPNYVNKEGSLSNISVKGNTITARCGILAAGLVTTRSLDKPSVNNSIYGISLTENTIYQRPQQPEFAQMGDAFNTGAGIIAADAISFHDYLIENDYSWYKLASGCSAGDVTISGNTIAEDFSVKMLNGLGNIDDSWEVVSADGSLYARKSVGACRIIKLTGVTTPHTHTGVKVEQVDATCTAFGVKAYYSCSCEKNFTDSACTNEIPDLAAWKNGDGQIPKKAHTGGTATCKAKAKCSVCGTEYGSLAAHTYGTTWKSDTTKHWHECSCCSAKKDSAAHKNITKTTKAATLTANGKKETKCSVCGRSASAAVIYYPKTFTLSKTSYEYTGSTIKPAVTIKDSNGAVVASTNYTVTYGTNKSVGKGTVKVTFKGSYSGTKTVEFSITPKKTTIGTPAIASDGITVKWTKNTTGSGYYIYRSINGASYKKVKTITSNATVSFKDTGAKTNGSKYQYKIYAYKTVSGTTYKSPVSSVKTVYFLTKPTVSSLTPASNGITVKWGKNTKAAGYYIYRSINGASYKKIKTITSNATVSFKDTGAKTNGSKYQYKIYAYKTVSGTTYKSPVSSVKTTYFVSRPTISSVKNSGAGKMTVKWGKNSKAGGYQIQYSKKSDFSSGNKTVTITSASTVSKVIKDLTKGKTYYVRIRAYKKAGSTKYYSAYSAKATVKIR